MHKPQKVLILIIASISFYIMNISTLSATSRCMVTDPTGTPLNIRDREKNIIDTIKNGQIIHILADGYDDRGKPWALISAKNGKSGWVYREFISC